jgi:CO dehydrogenase/acetyl-CoA synthase alpha subunit
MSRALKWKKKTVTGVINPTLEELERSLSKVEKQIKHVIT